MTPAGSSSVACAGGRRAVRFGPRRAAYTLLEIMVVVGLMVIIVSLSLPALQGMLADARLSASGDLIRGRLADTRSMAMEQGKAYRFGFIPGTGTFQIAADDDPVWDTVGSTDPVDQDTLICDKLLEDIVFTTDRGTVGDSAPTAGSSWQTGAVYLPDGTAHGPVNADGTTNDDANFYFGRAGAGSMAVQMRGLTGASRVFDPSFEGNQP